MFLDPSYDKAIMLFICTCFSTYDVGRVWYGGVEREREKCFI